MNYILKIICIINDMLSKYSYFWHILIVVYSSLAFSAILVIIWFFFIDWLKDLLTLNFIGDIAS